MSGAGGHWTHSRHPGVIFKGRHNRAGEKHEYFRLRSVCQESGQMRVESYPGAPHARRDGWEYQSEFQIRNRQPSRSQEMRA